MTDLRDGVVTTSREMVPSGSASARAPSFQIVPLRGLPVVAVVLAGLVTAIATNQQWAIDFFHVVGGGSGRRSTCSSGS